MRNSEISLRHEVLIQRSVCGRTMLMFGGRNSEGGCCEDLYEYHLDTCTWRSIEMHTHLFGRARHSAVVHNAKVFVFGGWNGKKKLNDLFVFNVDGHTIDYALEGEESTPSRRECHVAVVHNNSMIVFGGRFRGSFMSDTYEVHLGVKSLKDCCRDWILGCKMNFEHLGLTRRLEDFINSWRELTKRTDTRMPIVEEEEDEQGGSGSEFGAAQ